MGIYFNSNNENFSDIIEESNKNKQKIINSTTNMYGDEKIDFNDPEVKEILRTSIENNEVDEIVKHNTNKLKTEIKQTFARFTPAEIFERLNQITFLLFELNNRIGKLEETIANQKNNKKSDKFINEMINNPELHQQRMEETQKLKENLKPKELTADEYRKMVSDPNYNRNDIEIKNAEDANKVLDKMLDGEIPLIPDTPVEDIFPNMPEEAYEAYYKTSKPFAEKLSGKPIELPNR